MENTGIKEIPTPEITSYEMISKIYGILKTNERDNLKISILGEK